MAQREGSLTLSNDQLLKLSKVMYHKGAQAIHTMKFRSQYERAQYLKSCRDAHFDTQDLINATESAVNEFKDDHRITPIVNQCTSIVKNGICFALSTYFNRAERIQQLKKPVLAILKNLHESKLSPLNEARILMLAENTEMLSQVMLKYEVQTASLTARKIFGVSRVSGFQLQNLFRRCLIFRRIERDFEKLDLGQRLKVLEKILEPIGETKLLKNVAKAAKPTMEWLEEHGGIAIMGLALVTSAIDVYSANPDKMVETGLRNAVTVALGEVEGLLYSSAMALVFSGGWIPFIAGALLIAATYYGGHFIEQFLFKELTIGLKELEHVADDIELVSAVTGLAQIGDIKHNPFLQNLKRETGVIPTAAIYLTVTVPLGLLMILGKLGKRAKQPKAQTPSPPPPPISTFGLKVRGPAAPDIRVLARQIASTA